MAAGRPTVFTALAVGALLAAPAVASAEVDSDSFTTQAEVVAEAFDGAGETDPDRDRSGLAGFTEFLRTVNARDRNVDSGRGAKANVTQDTELIRDGDLVLGVDSSGAADSSYTDPNTGDSFEPFGTGTSELDVGFEVVNAPVQFTLTGRIEASVSAAGGGSAKVTVTDPTGAESVAEIESFDSGTDAENLDLTGTVNPGTRALAVDIDIFSGGNLAGGTSTADYDLELRFCTIVAAQPGQATLGTSGDDVICGRSGNEQLIGIGGNDRIFGLGGVDDISGGEGEDDIHGGEGDDLQLYGGPGNDTIEGGPGNDGRGQDQEVMAGGPGDDEIDGGPGNDLMYGRCGEAILGTPSPVCNLDPPAPGETDDDNLTGGSGEDSLFGDDGFNFLSGGKQKDLLIGGPLDDTILGGDGPDEASGGLGADRMEGGAEKDALDGNRGNDDLFGDAGPDTLRAFQGADCLVGGSDKDELQGNQGGDTFMAKDGTRDEAEGGPDTDRGRFDPQDSVSAVEQRNFQGGC